MEEKDIHSTISTTLMDHVRELRTRFVISALGLVLVGALAYLFYRPIIEFLRKPLGQTLYYNSPVGNFNFIMKICFMVSLAVAMPLLVYNLVMFIRPAFDKIISKKNINILTLSSGILAICGAAFGYYVILPGSLAFFSGFQTNGISALITTDSYLNFVLNIIITFILVFQLPLVISFIDTIKPIKPSQMLKMEKWVILGSLIISLMVPFAFDIITSLLIGLPIVVLYNLSVLIVILKRHQQKRTENSDVITIKLNKITPSNVTKSLEIDLIMPEILTINKYPLTAKARAGQDIIRINRPIEVAIRPVIVSRPRNPITLNQNSRIISDIRRTSRIPSNNISRASA